MSLKQFDGLMRFYRPRMSARDRFLTYKALNTSGAPMLRSHRYFKQIGILIEVVCLQEI